MLTENLQYQIQHKESRLYSRTQLCCLGSARPLLFPPSIPYCFVVLALYLEKLLTIALFVSCGVSPGLLVEEPVQDDSEMGAGVSSCSNNVQNKSDNNDRNFRKVTWKEDSMTKNTTITVAMEESYLPGISECDPSTNSFLGPCNPAKSSLSKRRHKLNHGDGPHCENRKHLSNNVVTVSTQEKTYKHDPHEFSNVSTTKYIQNHIGLHHETNQFKLLEYMKNGLFYSLDNPTNEKVQGNTIQGLSSKEISRIQGIQRTMRNEFPR